MEGVFQVSFGQVRIHADPEADALNRGVAAVAFTVGSDIFFRAGAYQPHSAAGQHLLAHELTHVVQQRAGSLGTSGGGNAGGTMTVGAADDRHEQEAEQTAHRVTAALQRQGPALTAPATSPGAALSRAHDPAVALAPGAPGVARIPDLTVRRFGLGDLWQAVTGAASAAWGGFTGALRGIAQAGYTAVTGTLHWAQAVVTGAGQLAGQAVTVVANAAHNATQFAVTVGGKVVGLVGQVTAQAIGQVMQTVAAARTSLAAVTNMAAFLGRKLHDAPAAFVRALQDKAHQVLMGVLGPDVSAILGGAAGTLALILKDPLKFLNNLGLALKAGFGMVSRNLKGVLQGGLMSWLSGSLGVTIPDGAVKFDVAGIIGLGLNALHLGYDALKAGVIAGLTKQGVKDAATVVSRLETGALAGFTLLRTIRAKGLAGAWDVITQQVRDSLGSALDGAKAAVMQWVTQHVIQGVIAQLVTLCTPVGDIVELLLTIYKAVQFFLDKMRALGQFMATLKDAVTKVATGDVWHAGAQVYNAVVASVPLLLGFIANLLGLGDVGAAVRNALAALTAPVRRIEAELIALIVSKGQALAATLHGPSKGGSATPPGQTTARTPTLQQQLDHVMVAALHALAKYDGKRERESDLQPTLDDVRQSAPYKQYKVQVLKPVPRGEYWAIYGKINPDETKATHILVAGTPTTALPHVGMTGSMSLTSREVGQAAINRMATITKPEQVNDACVALEKNAPGILERYKREYADPYIKNLAIGKELQLPLTYLKGRASRKQGKSGEADWIKSALPGVQKNNKTFSVQGTKKDWIPDIFTDEYVGDAKDVDYKDFDEQLQAFYMIAKQREFDERGAGMPREVRDLSTGEKVAKQREFVFIMRVGGKVSYRLGRAAATIYRTITY